MSKNYEPRFQNRPFIDAMPPSLLRGKAPVKASQRASTAFVNLRRLSQDEVDGVHHINISSRGLTDIGFAIDLKSRYRFKHDVFGTFETAQGFYNWLRSASKDDTYRTLAGKHLDSHTRNNDEDLSEYVVNFKYLIVNAMWQKIKAYPKLLEAFRESTLPLEMYYTQPLDRRDPSSGTIRNRPPIAQWIIPALHVMREAAKENTEPNLDYLIMDKTELESYYSEWREKMSAKAVVKNRKPASKEYAEQPVVKDVAIDDGEKQEEIVETTVGEVLVGKDVSAEVSAQPETEVTMEQVLETAEETVVVSTEEIK